LPCPSWICDTGSLNTSSHFSNFVLYTTGSGTGKAEVELTAESGVELWLIFAGVTGVDMAKLCSTFDPDVWGQRKLAIGSDEF